MQPFLLDVVNDTWMQAHGRDVVILSIMALLAIAAIVGIFIWVKKRKKAR